MHLSLGYIENIDFNFDMQCMEKKKEKEIIMKNIFYLNSIKPTTF